MRERLPLNTSYGYYLAQEEDKENHCPNPKPQNGEEVTPMSLLLLLSFFIVSSCKSNHKSEGKGAQVMKTIKVRAVKDTVGLEGNTEKNHHWHLLFDWTY